MELGSCIARKSKSACRPSLTKSESNTTENEKWTSQPTTEIL